jgi:protein CWC15
MSTAGRPTFHSAVGRASTSTIRSQHVSAKSQNSHTALKFRQTGQATKEEVQKVDLRTELEKKENKYVLESDKDTKWMIKEEEKKIALPLLLAAAANENTESKTNNSNVKNNILDLEKAKSKYDDDDIDFGDDSDSGSDSGSESDKSEEKEDDDAFGSSRSETRIYADNFNLIFFLLYLLASQTTRMMTRLSYKQNWNESEKNEH